jgi:hypothetical protein
MQRIVLVVFGVAVTALVAACNANSDALHVMESTNVSAAATIASYENMGATVTAQATAMNEKLATAQIQLTQVNSQVKELTGKMNAGVSQPVVVSASGMSTGQLDGTSAPNSTQPPAQNNATGNGLSFANVVTARGKDNDGCANGTVSTFNATDPAIWVVAEVHNYKRGTVFTAKWAGDGFDREDTWTINTAGAQICVHFYIEPKTLALKSGTYTVTMTAGDVTAQPVQFTVQSDAPQSSDVTPSQEPSGTK